ncbi:hypothetical protein BC628DRAFT_1359018, partial [Trametes gibbosa]
MMMDGDQASRSPLPISAPRLVNLKLVGSTPGSSSASWCARGLGLVGCLFAVSPRLMSVVVSLPLGLPPCLKLGVDTYRAWLIPLTRYSGRQLSHKGRPPLLGVINSTPGPTCCRLLHGDNNDRRFIACTLYFPHFDKLGILHNCTSVSSLTPPKFL